LILIFSQLSTFCTIGFLQLIQSPNSCKLRCDYLTLRSISSSGHSSCRLLWLASLLRLQSEDSCFVLWWYASLFHSSIFVSHVRFFTSTVVRSPRVTLHWCLVMWWESTLSRVYCCFASIYLKIIGIIFRTFQLFSWFFRQTLSVVLGDVQFDFFHRWFDFTFIISAVVSLCGFLMSMGLSKWKWIYVESVFMTMISIFRMNVAYDSLQTSFRESNWLSDGFPRLP
jgi:hypothetical protein